MLDRNTRWQTGDKIDIGLLQLFDELPRIRRHAVEKSSLPFGKKNVERERRFTRTAQSGNDHHLVARNFDVDVFQIVLARAMDADCAVGAVNSETRSGLSSASEFYFIAVFGIRCSPRGARAPQNSAQKSAGVRVVDLCDLFRRANANYFSARISRFRSKIDNPIGRLNHFKIVLDHDDRMTAVDQPLKNLQQHRHVIEMESSGRFVENEKITSLVILAILSGFRTARPARTPVSRFG